MAAYARTIVHFRDGLVERIEAERASRAVGRAPDVRHHRSSSRIREIRRHMLRSLPDDARHRHRRRRGGDDGDARQGRDRGGRRADFEPRHQHPPDPPRPGLRPRRRRAAGRPISTSTDVDGDPASRSPASARSRRRPSRPALAVHNAANWSTTVNGTTSQFFTAQQWALTDGRILTDAEEQSGKAVCVIGTTVQPESVPARGAGRPAHPHQAI